MQSDGWKQCHPPSSGMRCDGRRFRPARTFPVNCASSVSNCDRRQRLWVVVCARTHRLRRGVRTPANSAFSAACALATAAPRDRASVEDHAARAVRHPVCLAPLAAPRAAARRRLCAPPRLVTTTCRGDQVSGHGARRRFLAERRSQHGDAAPGTTLRPWLAE